MADIKICDRDKIQIRDLLVKGLSTIPTETIQRIVEQVMELPGWDKSNITDNAFTQALSTIIRETAQEWAIENRDIIKIAILKALNARQGNILENLTSSMDSYLSELHLNLYVAAKMRKVG